MNRIWSHAASLLAAGIIASAAVPACATNDESIFVRGVLAPSTNRTESGCTYQDDPSQALLFEGTFDLGVRDSYIAVVLVGNQMIARGSPNLTRAESNRVHLEGAVVRVTEPDGALIGEFTSYASGLADTQQNNQPDYGLMGVAVIDAPTKEKLVQYVPNRAATHRVLVNIKAFGRTLGGSELESGEYQFPVTVCNGCLVQPSDDPAQPGIDCLKPPETSGGGGGEEQLPCFPGQDEPTPCYLCTGRPACDNPG